MAFQWAKAPARPEKALSRLFRGKFRALIRKAALLDPIPSETWQQDWNVSCQALPNAEASIHYLAPYVFKVAISDHRILKVKETSVSFPYKKPGSVRLRTLTLDPLEFIRRFLQHVLPKGFMKVRYYGFLSPTAKVPLEDIKALVELAHGFTVTVPEIELPPWPQPNGQSLPQRKLGSLALMRYRMNRSARPAAADCVSIVRCVPPAALGLCP